MDNESFHIKGGVLINDDLHFAVYCGQIVVVGANPPKGISLRAEGALGVSSRSGIDEYRLTIRENEYISKVGMGVAIGVVTAGHSEIKAFIRIRIFSHNSKLQAVVINACGRLEFSASAKLFSAKAVYEFVDGVSV